MENSNPIQTVLSSIIYPTMRIERWQMASHKNAAVSLKVVVVHTGDPPQTKKREASRCQRQTEQRVLGLYNIAVPLPRSTRGSNDQWWHVLSFVVMVSRDSLWTFRESDIPPADQKTFKRIN